MKSECASKCLQWSFVMDKDTLNVNALIKHSERLRTKKLYEEECLYIQMRKNGIVNKNKK